MENSFFEMAKKKMKLQNRGLCRGCQACSLLPTSNQQDGKDLILARCFGKGWMWAARMLKMTPGLAVFKH